MTNPETPSITRDELDEFIRQLFVCHWILGQMISEKLERAWAEQDDANQDPMSADHYSLIGRAIGDVVDRHGAKRIKEATELIDEVMEAISDDSRIFPDDQGAATAQFVDWHSRPRPGRGRRR